MKPCDRCGDPVSNATSICHNCSRVPEVEPTSGTIHSASTKPSKATPTRHVRNVPTSVRMFNGLTVGFWVGLMASATFRGLSNSPANSIIAGCLVAAITFVAVSVSGID